LHHKRSKSYNVFRETKQRQHQSVLVLFVVTDKNTKEKNFFILRKQIIEK